MQNRDWVVIYYMSDDDVPLVFYCATATEGENWLQEGLRRRPQCWGFVSRNRKLPPWPDLTVIPFEQRKEA